MASNIMIQPSIVSSYGHSIVSSSRRFIASNISNGEQTIHSGTRGELINHVSYEEHLYEHGTCDMHLCLWHVPDGTELAAVDLAILCSFDRVKWWFLHHDRTGCSGGTNKFVSSIIMLVFYAFLLHTAFGFFIFKLLY